MKPEVAKKNGHIRFHLEEGKRKVDLVPVDLGQDQGRENVNRKIREMPRLSPLNLVTILVKHQLIRENLNSWKTFGPQ